MMINLIDQFREHLQPREDALRCFYDQGVQVEGWFKGEMLTFLRKKRTDFDREVKSGPENKKIDFLVKLSSQPSKIELKHWLVGKQKGASYDARWYFKQGRDAKGKTLSTGIQSDFDKLSASNGGDKYILIATTAKPSLSDWKEGIWLFNERARIEKSPIRLSCLTEVSQYPDYFFLGLLRLESLATFRRKIRTGSLCARIGRKSDFCKSLRIRLTEACCSDSFL